MSDKRSVHGGADSHLCVEVSALRPAGNGYDLWNVFRTPEEMAAQPVRDRAHLFGVYIRNPLAFHVEDFPIDLRRANAVAGCYAAVLGDAFRYADALAEHLGCPVISALPRPRFYEIEPQRDQFGGRGKDGETRFIPCNEDAAEHWAVFDMTAAVDPVLVDDFPSRDEAESFIGHKREG